MWTCCNLKELLCFWFGVKQLIIRNIGDDSEGSYPIINIEAKPAKVRSVKKNMVNNNATEKSLVQEFNLSAIDKSLKDLKFTRKRTFLKNASNIKHKVSSK